MKENRKHWISFVIIAIVILPLENTNLLAQNNTGRETGRGAGSGAFLGAIAGAVFGEGDIFDDALEGAVIGGGVGALAGALEGGRMDRQAKQQFDELVREFGEENLRGYVELIQCNHQKAMAYFKVGQVSEIEEHRLTGYWMEAVAEKDRRNAEKTAEMANALVELDPDIDDEQMARTAIDQYVLELRSDRRANQIPGCSN